VHKSGCTIINQDDCIAINDATNIVFTNNSCTDGHGISIGSIKTGDVVNGVTISNNLVINSTPGISVCWCNNFDLTDRQKLGLRIKTYVDNNHASVSNVMYQDNTVINA